jgi:hypothetical protein
MKIGFCFFFFSGQPLAPPPAPRQLSRITRFSLSYSFFPLCRGLSFPVQADERGEGLGAIRRQQKMLTSFYIFPLRWLSRADKNRIQKIQI